MFSTETGIIFSLFTKKTYVYGRKTGERKGKLT